MQVLTMQLASLYNAALKFQQCSSQVSTTQLASFDNTARKIEERNLWVSAMQLAKFSNRRNSRGVNSYHEPTTIDAFRNSMSEVVITDED